MLSTALGGFSKRLLSRTIGAALRIIDFKEKKITLHFMAPDSAHLCVEFQDLLPLESKKTVLMRSLDDYREASTGLNRLICALDECGRIVGTSAAVRANYGEHIKFHKSSPMASFVSMEGIEFMELSASIVHPDHRGCNLQFLMYDELCKSVKNFEDKKNRIFTAACVLGNFASCKNIMNAGLGITGLHRIPVNETECDIIVFAKHPAPSTLVNEKEEITGGDRILSDKTFLESYLDRGMIVYSEGSGKDRRYFATR